MNGLVEKAGFALLAMALHALAFAAWPQPGAQSQGAGGDSLITLQGATEQVETMVARWTEVAEPAQPVEIAAPQPPATEPPEPDLPTADRAPATAAPTALPDLSDAPVTPARPQPPLPLPLPAPVIAQAPSLPQPQPEQTAAEISEPAPEAPAQPRRSATTPLSPPQPPKLPQAAAPPPPPPEPPKPVRRAETARPSSAGAQAQRAAGSGGSPQAGTAGQSQAATLSPGQRKSLMASWAAQIRSRIERRQRGVALRGRVIVNLRVGRDGTLLGVALQRSSGHADLDEAALNAVRRAGRFPPAPKGLDAQSYLFEVPLSFMR